MTKRCTKCGETKPHDAFRLSAYGTLTSWCKACAAARQREYAKTPKGRAAAERAKAKARTTYRTVTVSEKRCSACGITKPATEFFRETGRKDGLRPYCKDCHNERRNEDPVRRRLTKRAYTIAHREHLTQKCHERRARSPERTREVAREQEARFYAEHPEARRAHNAVGKAVLRGKLRSPRFCESCHEARRLQAHHDDYSQPLEVRWLCARCHRLLHQEAS